MMPRDWTHTDCFEHFGTTPRNVQWSWSARNEETKVVAVTLWQHEFTKGVPGKLTFERGPVDRSKPIRPGHTELMGNLRYALDHAGGEVKVIVAVAKDIKADPKRIAHCRPTNMKVRVLELDEELGSFKLEADLERTPSTK